jgi:DNA-binding NarL/FixJ family response regulator
MDALSPREKEVYALVVEGLNNKDVAEKLFISPETAKHHVASIFSKLGVTSRIELIHFDYRNRTA